MTTSAGADSELFVVLPVDSKSEDSHHTRPMQRAAAVDAVQTIS